MSSRNCGDIQGFTRLYKVSSVALPGHTHHRLLPRLPLQAVEISVILFHVLRSVCSMPFAPFHSGLVSLSGTSIEAALSFSHYFKLSFAAYSAILHSLLTQKLTRFRCSSGSNKTTHDFILNCCCKPPYTFHPFCACRSGWGIQTHASPFKEVVIVDSSSNLTGPTTTKSPIPVWYLCLRF